MSPTLSACAKETRYETLRVLRTPGVAIPMLLFPVMFYVFFAVILGRFSAGGVKYPTFLMASYGTFFVMGPGLFGFGVGLAIERGLGWLRLRRTTPMPPLSYFTAKLATSLLFAVVVVLILFTLGATLGQVRLPRATWLQLFVTLVVGSVPFCAMGLAIGSWVSAPAAPAVVNLVYLPMGFLSGLWIPIQMFPPALQKVAAFLPPYHLCQLALSRLGMSRGGSDANHVLALALYGVLFLAIALLGTRRGRS